MDTDQLRDAYLDILTKTADDSETLRGLEELKGQSLAGEDTWWPRLIDATIASVDVRHDEALAACDELLQE